jgi:alanyl-tRNA synthetase
MEKLSTAQIRETFLRFFERNGHAIVPSSSLIPGNDPTLLFANSGMVQFKDVFLGAEQRPYKRATTAQKCLRVSGKHNDLEEVGPSPRHQTFFEMLGNFSFGDYFKREAIQLSWKLLTEEFKLPVERLWFTVFAGDERTPADEEAERYWIEAGADPSRVLRFGAKDNFWVMGDTGPCGPCSEITFYLGEDLAKMSAEGVNSDDPDYVEIWNNVFMQFDRVTMEPLPRPSIDTGMGLERMAMVMQNVKATYDTDAFTPIIRRTRELTGGDDAHYQQHRSAYRAVADHTRACAFLIADGVLPGKAGRSYVLRRILRRAAYQGRTIGLEKPFLAETAAVLIDQMGDAYRDLRTRREFILETITDEEQRFGRTLSGGLVLLNSAVDRMRSTGDTTLNGDEAFALYDTYGFPLDLTQRILGDQGLGVDEAGYDAAMEAQRERGRKAAQFKRGAEADAWLDRDLPASEFLGYTQIAADAKVLALLANGDDVSVATEGQQVQVVLDRTPFYAESGGQVGDTGTLSSADGSLTVRVDDTQRAAPGLYVHSGTVVQGQLAMGGAVQALVDEERRRDIQRNHTATHILQRALRDVVGEHAAQAGSLVAPDRLRFDFTHQRAITPEQLRAIEEHINAWVRADAPVRWDVTDYPTALQRGAIALFGEKYGDEVRVVHIRRAGEPAPGAVWTDRSEQIASRDSLELCGGTHVGSTGEIGMARIVYEGSVGSGLRRIEMVTGRGAEALVEELEGSLRQLSRSLSVPVAQVPARVEALLGELKQRQGELEKARSASARTSLEGLLGKTQQVGDVPLLAARVEAADAQALRGMGDWLRDKLGGGVIVLGSAADGKPQLLAMVTPDYVKKGYHAGNLVKALAAMVGGGGGGRADMAQAGGRDAAKLDEALASVAGLVERQGK